MIARGIFYSTACWAVLLTIAVGPAMANGVVRDGLGAISSGRGGTNIALWDNGSILLDNPAGMTNIHSEELYDFGIDTVFTDIHYVDPDNDVQAEFKPMPLSQASYIRRSCDGCIAYGLGAFAPAGFAAEYDMIGPAPIGGLHRYKSIGALAKFLAGGAYQVTDRLSLGGAVGLAASHAELEGPFFIQTGPMVGTPLVMDLQGTGAAFCWSAGLQYHLSDRTTLGAAYQSESRFKLDGVGKLNVPVLGTSEFDADTDLVWPRSVGVGLAHWLSTGRRISVDVIYFGWADSFDRLNLRLSNPTNPAFLVALGPSSTDQVPLEWHDSVSARVGYEQWLSCDRVVRLGYVHNSKNIPDRTLTPFIPATLEHTFSAGYGWQQSARSRVDLAYQFSFGPEAEVGQSALVGGDFSNSRIEASAHWLYINFQRTY